MGATLSLNLRGIDPKTWEEENIAERILFLHFKFVSLYCRPIPRQALDPPEVSKLTPYALKRKP